MKLDQALEACGIIAILRGVTPDEVIAVSQTLYDAGIRIVEVPLNSPEPFVSIERLAKAFADKMVVGAGTVLSAQDVNLLKEHGGQISVSPDCNPEVIARAVAVGLDPLPGVFTPTEAFAAIRAGAKHLKLFPAEVASPQTIKAWKAPCPAYKAQSLCQNLKRQPTAILSCCPELHRPRREPAHVWGALPSRP